MVLITAALAAQLEEAIPLPWEIVISILDHAKLLSLLGALAKLSKRCAHGPVSPDAPDTPDAPGAPGAPVRS